MVVKYRFEIIAFSLIFIIIVFGIFIYYRDVLKIKERNIFANRDFSQLNTDYQVKVNGKDIKLNTVIDVDDAKVLKQILDKYIYDKNASGEKTKYEIVFPDDRIFYVLDNKAEILFNGKKANFDNSEIDVIENIIEKYKYTN